MKLTTQQIEKINETLTVKGLIYDDIKLEVTDHIASEIENAIKDNSISFDVAFDEVFNNWETELKITSNWWSSGFVAPKIAIDKYELQLKKLFKFAFLCDLTFSFLIVVLTYTYPQEITYTILKMVYVTCYSIVFFLIVYFWLINRKLKTKSIFGEMFRGTFYLCLCFLINYLFNSGEHLYRHYVWDSVGSKFIQWFMHGFFMFMGVYLIILAFEHFKNVKKYKLV